MPVDHSASSLITSATLLSFGSTITISCAVRKNLCALICGTFCATSLGSGRGLMPCGTGSPTAGALGRGRVGLHVLDELFDGVSLFQREIELGGRARVPAVACARLRRSLRMRERGDRRQHQREGNKGACASGPPETGEIGDSRHEASNRRSTMEEPFSSGIVPSTVATCGARVRPATSPYGCSALRATGERGTGRIRFAPS